MMRRKLLKPVIAGPYLVIYDLRRILFFKTPACDVSYALLLKSKRKEEVMMALLGYNAKLLIPGDKPL